MFSDSSFVFRPSSVLKDARAALRDLDDANTTADALLAHVTGLTRTQILTQPEMTLSAEQADEFGRLVARAAAGEPLAYLTGRREFFGLELEADAHVLVPRPETERLVELALAAQPRRVLDVGTGSGCIAVTVAANLPGVAVTASDISAEALAVARRNAQRHQVADRIVFVQSDLLSAFQCPASSLQPPFDLITANLPYIDTDELSTLPVAQFEPRLALDGGPGGLMLVERLLGQAPGVLRPGGRLLLEIGATQGTAAAALAKAAFPRADVHIACDWAGLDRVLVIETR